MFTPPNSDSTNATSLSQSETGTTTTVRSWSVLMSGPNIGWIERGRKLLALVFSAATVFILMEDTSHRIEPRFMSEAMLRITLGVSLMGVHRRAMSTPETALESELSHGQSYLSPRARDLELSMSYSLTLCPLSSRFRVKTFTHLSCPDQADLHLGTSSSLPL